MGYQEALQLLAKSGVQVTVSQHNIAKVTTSQDLASGSLNYTSQISDKFIIRQVLIHASAALADTTITVKFNSETGANYDTIIGVADFDNTQDLALISGENMKGVSFEDGDEVTILSSGATNVGILYVTLGYETLI